MSSTGITILEVVKTVEAVRLESLSGRIHFGARADDRNVAFLESGLLFSLESFCHFAQVLREHGQWLFVACLL